MSDDRHVLYFCNRAIEKNPPCLTECCMLRDMGVRVTLVTIHCDDLTRRVLEEKGVRLVLIPADVNRQHGFIQRIRNYLLYNRIWPEIIKKYWTAGSVIWYGTEGSWTSQYHNTGRLRPNIVNCLEFYEDGAWQKGMKAHLSDIDILTACEPTRAEYMKNWWHLPELPFVLRNKPYFHPRKRNLPGSTEQTREAIAKLEGKKVLLYQGAIVADRDLGALASSLAAVQSDFTLVLSGPVSDGTADIVVGRLKERYADTLYLGNIPSPLHLEITSHADICVAFYKDNNINNRYCAPNKIYEYTGFGIPVLCNEIPGLTSTIGKYQAGICTDLSDPEAVCAALLEMEQEYGRYCANAMKFYDETDNRGVMKKIMERVSNLL